MLCHACIEEPKGVQGHPSLRPDLYRETGEDSAFICDVCHAVWRRNCTANGQFQWTRLDSVSAKSYSLWSLIRRIGRQQFLVAVRAIALRSDTLIQPGDTLSETCQTFEEATRVRDELIDQLKRAVTDRGDTVVSVDSTLEI